MKLEVGMYVRTNNGIKQIYRIDNNKTKYKYLFKLKKQDGDGCIDCGVLSSEDILKASHTLLGNDKEPCLIEPGDYVNGKLVVYIYDIYTSDNIFIGKYLYEDDKSLIGGEEDIKSIVTREQFEAMTYKVVEE